MSTQAAPKSYWAVMRAQRFTDIETTIGIPLRHPPEGPQRFIPVFDTKEQAVEWNGGDHNVKQMIVTS